MKRTLMLLTLLTSLNIWSQDLLILRDGREHYVKVIQFNPDVTIVRGDGGKSSAETVIDNSDIYMIRTEQKGNICFDSNGDRFTGTFQGFPEKEAIIIYLNNGSMVYASNVSQTPNIIRFQLSQAKSKSLLPFHKRKNEPQEIQEVSKKDVFMLKYPDGTREVLTMYEKKMKEQTTDDVEESLPTNNKQFSKSRNRKIDNRQLYNDNIANSEIQDENEDLSKHTLPWNAILHTSQGKMLEALILSDDGEIISYKRKSNINGPTYQIKRENVTKIDYSKEGPKPAQTVSIREEYRPVDTKLTFPCEATIVKRSDGKSISAQVLSDDGKVVRYKLKAYPKGKTYTLQHTSIKTITYNIKDDGSLPQKQTKAVQSSQDSYSENDETLSQSTMNEYDNNYTDDILEPYCLYEKGAVAEYCIFIKDSNDKGTFYTTDATYLQQIVDDVRENNGTLEVYVRQQYYNKKHEPKKALPQGFKNQVHQIDIDEEGNYYFVHNIALHNQLTIKSRKGFGLFIPNNMDSGTEIKSGTVLTTQGNGNYADVYSGWKVDGEEEIRTPAGTFDCIRLRGKVKSRIPGYDSSEDEMTIWFARGIGIVRTSNGITLNSLHRPK